MTDELRKVQEALEMINDFLEKYGIKLASGVQMKFGQGVVGKSTYAFIFLVILIGLAIWKLNDEWMIFSLIIIAIVIFIYFFRSIIGFATEHPEISVLEGATLVASS